MAAAKSISPPAGPVPTAERDATEVVDASQVHFTCESGEVYEGEFKNDMREGWGVMRRPDGGVYEGYWHHDKQEGWGTERYATGNIYEGHFVAGLRQGTGTYKYADGVAEIGRYEANADVGEGVRWNADRTKAGMMMNGEVVCMITLEDAAQIAEALGVPVPTELPS